MEKVKTIAKNPNAYHNYEIIEKIECRNSTLWHRNKIHKKRKS